MENQQYQLVDLHIDINAQRVYRNNEVLDVGGLSFTFFAFLLTKGTTTVSFDEIVENVWAPAQVNNDTITQRVRLLRKALGDTEKQPKYIRSVRGIGYQLCAQPLIHQSTRAVKGKVDIKLVAAFCAMIAILGTITFYVNQDQRAQVNVVQSLYEERLERAQHYLNQREQQDITRALDLLEKIELEGASDPKWLITKSFVLSTQVCRFGAPYQLTEEAENLAQQASLLNASSRLVAYAKAYAYDCRGNKLKAIEEYRNAASAEPEMHAGIYSSLAYLLGESGMLAESLTIHRQLHDDQAKESFLYLQMARNYALLQHHELASHFYKLSFELYPENVFSNSAYPRFLFSQKRFEEVQEAIEKVQLRPYHSDFLLLKADWYLRSNDKDRAQAALLEAIKMKPTLPFYQTLYQINQTLPRADLLTERLNIINAMEPSYKTSALVLFEKALIFKELGDDEASTTALINAISAGYLDKDFLSSSRLVSSIRDLPSFDFALQTIDEHVDAQRALLPAEYFAVASN